MYNTDVIFPSIFNLQVAKSTNARSENSGPLYILNILNVKGKSAENLKPKFNSSYSPTM
jgi:hypothetical protein